MSSDPLVCSNLDRSGVRRRAGLGVAMGLVALAGWAALVAAEAPRGWRLALFVPFLGAALGVLQARGRT